MKTREKGSIVALTAILMVALIAILGLAIDFGTVFTARTFLQHAADAGALAGADTYAQYTPTTQAMATTEAQQAAEDNKVLGQTLTASNVTVSFPSAPAGYDRVRVDVNMNVPTFFLKILGSRWNTVTIGAHAIAEAAPGSVGETTCLRPLWIKESYLLGGSCTNPVPAVGSTIYLWDTNACSSQQQISSGCVNSQWGLIDPVSLGYPASDIASWIMSCSSVVVNCQSQMGPKTGASVGEVGTGNPRPVQTLIGQQGTNNDWTWPSPYTIGDYVYNGQSYSSSPAVVTVAIWNDCSVPPIPGSNQMIPISGFAQLFIDHIDVNGGGAGGKSITAQFISMTNSCTGNGSGTGPGSNIASGPGAIPVRLIHPDTNPAN